ncbi:M23 family metallopeptidase [Chryseobacterium chendengshani]|uniref:peptidoglycan DD-metalloendopeptidase family protein n=1 Tax=Chryseobacterium sp. LJ668 TaxID=2864040 RepID=UPI001C693B17|nr:peptidoglycan DD-metalloendopeptidase family protein [Chryseobacterium sp. LJ668]MBW8523207.1 M23 family metallopeptidase [Chryseobacterium sp. LJ668]QYK15501.1 M23 family metallopeptidase [Chryseobacterium sp. LJ668]
MKTKLLMIIFSFLNCWVFSQYRCPMNSGTIILFQPKPDFHPYDHPDETRDRIQSKNNQVISVSSGKVIKIIQSDSDYSIIIKSSSDNFFVYSNLSNTLFKENDSVEKDQLLGLAIYDKYYASYVMDFQFWKKDESVKVDLKCSNPD